MSAGLIGTLDQIDKFENDTVIETHLPQARTMSHYANKFNTASTIDATHKKLAILNLLFVPSLVRLKIQMIDRSHLSLW